MVESQRAVNAADKPGSDDDALWERLSNNPEDNDASEILIKKYLPLVHAELGRARSRLPRHVDIQELEAAGLEALFMAIRNFRRSFGVNFESYARKPIWGAMIDRLRGLDGVPRTARRASKLLSNANISFTQRTGRTADVDELAAEMGTSAVQLGRLERQAQVSNKLSLDVVCQNGHADESGAGLSAAVNLSKDEDSPLEKLADAETQELLVQGLMTLPDRERSILVLYYHEGIMFTEIAAAMDVSESRVSQMHSRALERLKRYMLTPNKVAQTSADTPLPLPPHANLEDYDVNAVLNEGKEQ